MFACVFSYMHVSVCVFVCVCMFLIVFLATLRMCKLRICCISECTVTLCICVSKCFDSSYPLQSFVFILACEVCSQVC